MKRFILALLVVLVSVSFAYGAESPKWKITIPGKSGSLCNSPTYIA